MMNWEDLAVRLVSGCDVGEEFTVSVRKVGENIFLDLSVQGHDNSAVVWKGEIKEWKWKELLLQKVR